MFRAKRILVVVPARGGSKGIKLKNLRALQGVSLVARTGQLVAQLDYVDRAVVSTDHEDIAAAAQEAGLAAPFRRPAAIAGDQIGDWEVLIHALTEMERRDECRYDVILMLQPTSPLRTATQVTATLERLLDSGADAVWTVSETDSKHHPRKQLKLRDQAIDYYDASAGEIVARQQLQPLYHRNGVAYAMTRSCLVDQRTIKGARTVAHVIEEPLANIDSEIDFLWAEFLLSQLK